MAMWSAQLSVIDHLGFGRHSTCVGRPFFERQLVCRPVIAAGKSARSSPSPVPDTGTEGEVGQLRTRPALRGARSPQVPESTGRLEKVVGGLGFEPRLAESESAVLPLDDPPDRHRGGAAPRPVVGRPFSKAGRACIALFSPSAPWCGRADTIQCQSWGFAGT